MNSLALRAFSGVHWKLSHRARSAAASMKEPCPAISDAPCGKWTEPRITDAIVACSPVHLPEHDVDRAQHCGRVGEHVALHHEVHRLEVREAGRANLAAVGPVGAVGDEIDAEFALGALGRDVNLARGHVKALRVELEVVDE